MRLMVMAPPSRTAALGSRIASQPISTTAKAFTARQKRSFSSTTTTRSNPLLHSGGSRPSWHQPPKPTDVPISTPSSTSSFFTPSLCRQASTAASVTPSSNTTSPASSIPLSTPPLDWNTFFKLRKSRRRYALASSILSSLGTTAFGAGLISSQELDSWGAQIMGLEPMVALGLATFAFGAVGWLAGPFVGTAIWRQLHRRSQRDIAAKEKGFYDRIKKYRVDPSSSSAANPVPDYYGEKIGSVTDYRQWLKDQRAFNRKRRMYLG